eukprot:COSAG02_NODE_2765_length_8068_cov_6.824319_7_plen_127_part_00
MTAFVMEFQYRAHHQVSKFSSNSIFPSCRPIHRTRSPYRGGVNDGKSPDERWKSRIAQNSGLPAFFHQTPSIFPFHHVSIEILPLSHGKLGMLEKFQVEFRLLTMHPYGTTVLSASLCEEGRHRMH